MNNFKLFIKWIAEAWFWLWGPLILLIPLFLSIFCYVLPIQLSAIGIIYQLVGMICIIIGINNKLESFSDFNIYKLPVKWWRRRPFWNKRKAHYSGGTGRIVTTGTASGYVKFNLEEYSTVEEKFLLIEKAINKLRERDSKLKSQKSESEEILMREMEKVQREMNKKIRVTENKLSEGFTNDYKLELFGALLILIGILSSGFEIWLV